MKSCMNIFRRVESIAKVDGKFRALDLTEEHVRKAIADSTSVIDLYRGPTASNYAPDCMLESYGFFHKHEMVSAGTKTLRSFCCDSELSLFSLKYECA